MPVEVYYLLPSIPCRAVIMLAKALGIHLNLKIVDIMEGDHLKLEFRMINPQHTIPTINDNGFILWESRAIMGYFVEKYAKNDAYYPKDPQRRATVDQRLYFDVGTLNKSFLQTYYPILFGDSKIVDHQGLQALEKAFEILDSFLDGNEFVAGDDLTIADFTMVATVSTADVFGFDIKRYDNVSEWTKRCAKAMAEFKYEEVNVAGSRMMGEIYRNRLRA